MTRVHAADATSLTSIVRHVQRPLFVRNVRRDIMQQTASAGDAMRLAKDVPHVRVFRDARRVILAILWTMALAGNARVGACIVRMLCTALAVTHRMFCTMGIAGLNVPGIWSMFPIDVYQCKCV